MIGTTLDLQIRHALLAIFVGGDVRIGYLASTFEDMVRVTPDGSSRDWSVRLSMGQADRLESMEAMLRRLVLEAQDHAIRAYGLTQRMADIRKEEQDKAAAERRALSEEFRALSGSATENLVSGVALDAADKARLRAQAETYMHAANRLARNGGHSDDRATV